MNGTAVRAPAVAGFRLGRTGWLLLLVAVAAALWYAGAFAPLHAGFHALADRPDVRDAFTDREHGRLDALLLLVSFFLLTPFALLIGLAALIFAVIVVSLLLGPLLQALRLPGWFSLPIVLLGLVWAAQAVHDDWAPHAVHLAALVARAWVVYFSTPVGN